MPASAPQEIIMLARVTAGTCSESGITEHTDWPRCRRRLTGSRNLLARIDIAISTVTTSVTVRGPVLWCNTVKRSVAHWLWGEQDFARRAWLERERDFLSFVFLGPKAHED